MSSKRDELHRQILLEEEEKQRVQHDLHILTERLAAINEGLARKIAIRNDYDRTIAETEGAYKKVCDIYSVCVCSSSLSPPHIDPGELTVTATCAQERVDFPQGQGQD